MKTMRNNNKNNPFRVPIKKSYGLTNEDIHRFIEEFTDRYSVRLCMGEDMRTLYDFELEAFSEGNTIFYIDSSYTNEAGITITVKSRGEGFLIVEYEGELLETNSLFFGEEGVEGMVVSDILFFADQIYNETNKQ